MPTVLITGANRGLGLEFARQYVGEGWKVIGTARAPDEADELRSLQPYVRVEALDLADLQAVTGFAARLQGEPLDLLIANAGTMGPMQLDGPDDAEAWADTLRTNAIAPALLARTLLPNLADARGKLVAITSKMGSIADNSSGGYIAYRSSKAALNAAWKSIAIEAAGKSVVAAVLHPGWVQTRMGGGSAPLTPQESVSGMRRVISALGPGQTGAFLNYDGEPIPW